MNEGQPLRINRGRFLTLGAAGAFLVATQGVLLNEKRFGFYGEIDAETEAELLKFSPITSAHRGGNSPGRLDKSVSSGCQLAEMDIRYVNDELVVGHEEYKGPLAVDFSRQLFRLGPPPHPMDELLQYARVLDLDVILDIKFKDKTAVNKLVRSLGQFGMRENTAFTGNWQSLDRISAQLGRDEGFYYSIDNPREGREFLESQGQMNRRGVSLAREGDDSDVIRAFHEGGAVVIVYDITKPSDALIALKAGADGIMSNNLTLLKVFEKEKLTHF